MEEHQDDAAADEFDARRVLEALKATRELDVNLQGLQTLHRQLLRPDAPRRLQQLLQLSPQLSELANIWAAQLQVKQQKILAALLATLAQLLLLGTHGAEHSTTTFHPAASTKGLTLTLSAAGSSVPVRHRADRKAAARHAQDDGWASIAAAKQHLVAHILSTRLKSIYHALGSDHTPTVSGALQLLAALAKQGPGTARELAAALDFSLPALAALARPPRGKGQHGAAAVVSRGPEYWAEWDAADASSRPSRALFVDFALSLLELCDDLTLLRLLSINSLMGGVLHHLSTDPPACIFRTLRLLASRVLAAGSGVPAPVRARPFTDAALQQLATVVAQPAEEAEEAGDGSETGPKGSLLAATAAEELLGSVITDPSHGLAAEGRALALLTHSAQFPAGMKRILRLLPRLQPVACEGHARLLQLLATRQPAVAAEFTTSLPFSLEPAATSQWVAAAALVAGLLTRICSCPAAAASPQLAAHLAAAAGPPEVDSQVVRSHLRHCIPPSLSKAALSRGVQHPRPVVQLLSLQLLEALLLRLAPLMEAAQQAAGSGSRPPHPDPPSQGLLQLAPPSLPPAAAPQPDDSSPDSNNLNVQADRWKSFLRSMRSIVRSRLPEPHTLLSLHALVERQHKLALAGGEERGAAAAAAATGAEGAAADEGDKSAGAGAGSGADVGEPAVDDAGAAADAAGDAADGAELRELEAAVFEEAGEAEGAGEAEVGGAGSSAAAARGQRHGKVLLALIKVFAAYQRVLPRALEDAHFDATKLLPADIVQAPAALQSAAVELLELEAAAAAARGAGKGRVLPALGGVSAARMLPLLRLACMGAGGAVRAAAARLAAAKLRDATGVPRLLLAAAAAPDEPAAAAAAAAATFLDESTLWLWMLPSSDPSPPLAPAPHPTPTLDTTSPSAPRSEAVAAFLTNTLVQLTRRPHEVHELVEELLSKAAVPSCQSRHVSLLAVAAVRGCLKALPSPKMASADKAAICSYVSGVLKLLLEALPDPAPLLAAIQQLLLMDEHGKADPSGEAGKTDDEQAGQQRRASIGGSSANEGLEVGVGLPAEGRCLLLVHDWAVGWVRSPAREATPGEGGGRGRKRKGEERGPDGAAAGGGVGLVRLAAAADTADDEETARRCEADVDVVVGELTAALQEQDAGAAAATPAARGKRKLKQQQQQQQGVLGSEPLAAAALCERVVSALAAAPLRGVRPAAARRVLRSACSAVAGALQRRGAAGAGSLARAAALLVQGLPGQGLGLEEMGEACGGLMLRALLGCLGGLEGTGSGVTDRERVQEQLGVAVGLVALELLRVLRCGTLQLSPQQHLAVLALLDMVSPEEAAVIAAAACRWRPHPAASPATSPSRGGAEPLLPLQRGGDRNQWFEVLRHLLLPPWSSVCGSGSQGQGGAPPPSRLNAAAAAAALSPGSGVRESLEAVAGGAGAGGDAAALPLLAALSAAAAESDCPSSSCPLHGPRSAAAAATAGLGPAPWQQPPSHCLDCTAARAAVARLCSPLTSHAVRRMHEIASQRGPGPPLNKKQRGAAAKPAPSPPPQAGGALAVAAPELRACMPLLAFAVPQQVQALAAELLEAAQQLLVRQASGPRRGAGTESSGSDAPLVVAAIAFQAAAAAVRQAAAAAVPAADQQLPALVAASQQLLTALLPELSDADPGSPCVRDVLGARDALLSSMAHLHFSSIPSQAQQQGGQGGSAGSQQQQQQQQGGRGQGAAGSQLLAVPTSFDLRLWLRSAIACPTLAAAASLAPLAPPHAAYAAELLLRALGPAPGAAAARTGGPELVQQRRRRTLALMLPLASTLLASEAPLEDSCTAGRPQSPEQEQERRWRVALASMYREPLLAYAGRKRKKQHGEGGAPAAQEAPEVAEDVEVVACLKAHAIATLKACLQLQPLHEEERVRCMQKLLPSGGLPLNDVSGLPIASASEQLELAHWLLLQEGTAAGSIPDNDAAAASLASLLPLLTCCCATLVATFKSSSRSTQQQQQQQDLQRPDPDSALQAQLLACLDGTVGDRLSALSAAARQLPAFGEACSVVSAFSGAALKHAASRSRVIRCVRRLVAALLPGGEEDEDEGEGEGEEAEVDGGEGEGEGEDGVDGSGSEDEVPAADEEMEVGDEEEEDGEGDGMEHDEGQEEGVGDEGAAAQEGEDCEAAPASDGPEAGEGGGALAPAGPEPELLHAALAELPPLDNAAAAAAAAAMLQRAARHPLLAQLGAGAGAELGSAGAQEGCCAPLPAFASQVAVPLSSVFDLVPLPALDLERGATPPTPGAGDGLTVELLLLLESLLEMCRASHGGGGGDGGAWPAPGSDEAAGLHGLLRLLQCAYGASCSVADRVCLRLLFTLDTLLQDQHLDLITARLSGPLSRSGYLWGPAARRYYEDLDALAAAVASGCPPTRQRMAELQLRVLEQCAPADVRRTALACTWFPAERSLAADEDDLYGDAAGVASGAEDSSSAAAAAYDPAYLLPFCLACLGAFHPAVPGSSKAKAATAVGLSLDVSTFVQWGLLAVCLRSLSLKDPPLRALAYEALGRFTSLLELSECRERAQLSVLLAHVRNGVQQPRQRLPSSACLLLAEASLGMCAAGAATYGLLNRAILRKEALGASDAVDFAMRLLAGGGPQHKAEQLWAAKLLYCGLQDGGDTELYRRKYVLERLCAAHGGPGAGQGSALGLLLLGTVLRAASLPSLAFHLALNTGVVPWLCSFITRGLADGLLPSARISINDPTVNLAKMCVSALKALASALRVHHGKRLRQSRGDGGDSGLSLLPPTLVLAAAQIRNALLLLPPQASDGRQAWSCSSSSSSSGLVAQAMDLVNHLEQDFA